MCVYIVYNYDVIIAQNYSEFQYPSHSAGVKTKTIGFKKHNSAKRPVLLKRRYILIKETQLLCCAS